MKEFAVSVILFISNLFRAQGISACRFHPSCSAYSVQAFRSFSFLRPLGS